MHHTPIQSYSPSNTLHNKNKEVGVPYGSLSQPIGYLVILYINHPENTLIIYQQKNVNEL